MAKKTMPVPEQGNDRGSFGSNIGFLLSAIGSAVGLGNIWKFPGKAYEGGGGAFILIYLAIVIVIGLPVMLSELSLGRAAQSNAVGTFRKLGRGFGWVGYIGVFVAAVIACYYSHVGGWVLRYVVSYVTEPAVVYADPLGYFYHMLGYNAAADLLSRLGMGGDMPEQKVSDIEAF